MFVNDQNIYIGYIIYIYRFFKCIAENIIKVKLKIECKIVKM